MAQRRRGGWRCTGLIEEIMMAKRRHGRSVFFEKLELRTLYSVAWGHLACPDAQLNGPLSGEGNGAASALNAAVPVTGTTSSATFLATDTTTQGKWSGTYGADGNSIEGITAGLPSYATVTVNSAATWTWAANTADPRALQTSTGGIAACWYGGSFTINLNLTDGNAHKVSLYAVDWDSTSRSEQIQLLDSSGNLLNAQTLNSFHNGEYLSWTLTGAVQIRVTCLAGANAVVDGLFFDSAAAPASSATFLKTDTTTQGSWLSSYGADGYSIEGAAASLPSYATLAVNGASTWTWAANTTDARALQTSSGGLATCWYNGASFTFDINLTDGQAHQVSLYAVDWDSTSRNERIDVLDASGNLLNTQTLSAFHGGEYLSWTIRGHVQIRVTNNGGGNAVVSGLFFGAAAAPASTAPTAPTGLTVSSNTYNAVGLTWTDTATNATGYYLYRSTDGTNYTLLATLGATATTYTDSTVAASTGYWYQVTAYNSAGASAAAATTAATPAAPAPSGVTVTTRNLTSFTELYIDGTSGNDVISLSQAGTTFTIIANGQVQTITGTFGDVVIKGESGTNTITVNSSVNIATLLYSGTGNSTLVDYGTNYNTLVTIGGGTCSLTGNGSNTNYWADSTDTINASATEIAAGDVHRVASMVTPAMPSDAGSTFAATNSSLFGTGPTFYDVNQRSIADCYFLGTIQSLAISNPNKLRSLAVDLGNGTYLAAFDRSNVTTYVCVNNTFSTGQAILGASGNDWALVMEKAYAYYRSGSDTFASLNFGSAGAAASDLGITTSSNTPSATSNATLFNLINTEIAAHKIMMANTSSSAPNLVSGHTYSVVSTSTDASGNMYVTLRNPWGFDGGNIVDSNPNDGLVTMSLAVFKSNILWMDYQA